MGGYTRGTGPDTAADGTPAGRPGFIGREFLEIGTLLFAAGAAHLLVLALGHSDVGAPVLVGAGAALIIGSSCHRWWRHRAGATATVALGGVDPAPAADAHELNDTAGRALSLAAGLIAGTATLPRSLAALSGAGGVEHQAVAPPGLTADGLSGERMALASPEGGVLVLSRPGMPFTAVEFARCRALVDVAGSLHSLPRPDRH